MTVIKVKLNNREAWLPFNNYEDLGIYKLFAELIGQASIIEFYQHVLGKLEKYDQINSTGYLNFLRLYLEYDGSATKIGQHEFMHRNTVLYKVKKIEEILDCDLSNTYCKAGIMVAFAIRDVL